MSRLVSCQHHNSRLTEQLTQARATLDCKEEELIRLSQDLEESNAAVKRCEIILHPSNLFFSLLLQIQNSIESFYPYEVKFHKAA